MKKLSLQPLVVRKSTLVGGLFSSFPVDYGHKVGGAASAHFALGDQAEGIYALSTHEGVSRAALEDFWNAVGACWPWFARLFRGFWL